MYLTVLTIFFFFLGIYYQIHVQTCNSTCICAIIIPNCTVKKKTKKKQSSPPPNKKIPPPPKNPTIELIEIISGEKKCQRVHETIYGKCL